MSDADAPLHGSKPPKPSLFPLLALVVLGGGAFAANVRWRAEPAWVAPAASAAGLAACLIVFWLGRVICKSRRAGFFAALTLAVLGASQWQPPPFELRHLLLLLLIPAALVVGWTLDRFREGRFGRGGDLAARVLFGIFGALLALSPFATLLGLFGNPRVLPGSMWVALAAFAAAGAVVTAMALAGNLSRWPTPEATLVLAAGFVTWAGLVTA